MALPEVTQRDLQCTNCGGQCVFAPDHGGLECTSCGTVRSVVPQNSQDASAEFPLDANALPPDVELAQAERTHTCQTCGGSVVFVGPALSERCAYCDGPVVLSETDSSYQTTALIPFRVTETQAQELAQAWVSKRFCAPLRSGLSVGLWRGASPSDHRRRFGGQPKGQSDPDPQPDQTCN